MTIHKLAGDDIWFVRKIFSRPNYAVLKLLSEKSPRTTKEIYSLLGKKFTRKTLIVALKNLSMTYSIIEPTHIRTESGYDLGYSLSPKFKELITDIEALEKKLEKYTNRKG